MLIYIYIYIYIYKTLQGRLLTVLETQTRRDMGSVQPIYAIPGDRTQAVRCHGMTLRQQLCVRSRSHRISVASSRLHRLHRLVLIILSITTLVTTINSRHKIDFRQINEINQYRFNGWRSINCRGLRTAKKKLRAQAMLSVCLCECVDQTDRYYGTYEACDESRLDL